MLEAWHITDYSSILLSPASDDSGIGLLSRLVNFGFNALVAEWHCVNGCVRVKLG